MSAEYWKNKYEVLQRDYFNVLKEYSQLSANPTIADIVAKEIERRLMAAWGARTQQEFLTMMGSRLNEILEAAKAELDEYESDPKKYESENKLHEKQKAKKKPPCGVAREIRRNA